ncbi:hypothetical protein J2X69_003921 [Algoriphagus sp. 4150]|nr:hypothetical protein [Algoriphagus sp. 4150]
MRFQDHNHSAAAPLSRTEELLVAPDYGRLSSLSSCSIYQELTNNYPKATIR